MSGDAVVYVHGLWVAGHEALLLRRRLWRAHQWPVHRFRYAAARDSLADITAGLRDYIAAVDAERVHLLGHSLGGLVILRCLERYALPRPGRVVFAGTPANACRSATSLDRWRLGRYRLGRRLLGPVIAEELLVARERQWNLPRELGLIAGSRPLGMGRLVVDFDEPNDGTVAVSETRLAGATAHLTLPVTHTTMLLSPRVAREVWSFFEHGRFGSQVGNQHP